MRLLRRLQSLFRLSRVDAELAEEMEFHRAMKKRELEHAGLSEKDVAGAVARAMGNMTSAREEARGVNTRLSPTRYYLRTRPSSRTLAQRAKSPLFSV